MNIIIQLIGIGAMILSILSLQLHTKGKILAVQSLAAMLFCIHYALLGGFTGSAINGVSIIRNLLFHISGKSQTARKILAMLFILVNIATGVIFWESPVSLLFMTGMVFNTISMSCQNLQKVRLFMLISSPFILIYSIITRSIGGVINEILSSTSAITALILNKNRNEPADN